MTTRQRGIEWRITKYSFAIFSNAQCQSPAQSVPLTPRFMTTQSAINLPRLFIDKAVELAFTMIEAEKGNG